MQRLKPIDKNKTNITINPRSLTITGLVVFVLLTFFVGTGGFDRVKEVVLGNFTDNSTQ